jgi:large repetitive protein
MKQLSLVLFLSIVATFSAFAQADLSLTMTAPATAYQQWNNMEYHIVITNSGPSATNNVKVKIPIVSPFAYTSHYQSQGTFELFYTEWNVGTLASGEKDSIILNLFMMNPTSQKLFAQVSNSSATDPDSQPNSNTGTTPAQDDEAALTLPSGGGPCCTTGGTTADLSMAITTTVAGVNVGLVEPVTIKLTNNGTANTNNVTAKVVIPAGMTYVSHTSVLGTFTPSTGIWDLGTINTGADRTLSLNLVSSVGGPTKLFAQVTNSSATDPDSAPNNNSTTNPVEDDEAALILNNLQVDMELDVALPAGSTGIYALNSIIPFTVSLKNVGFSTGVNTKVRAILPPGLEYVSSTVSLGEYNTALGIWIVGDVPVSTIPKVMVINAKVVAAGPITYVCEVRTVNEPDIDSTPSNFVAGEDDQDQVTISTSVSTQADLSLSLSALATSLVPGSNTTVTIALTNSGPVATSGVTVGLPIPSGWTVGTTTASVGTWSAGTWTVGSMASGANATLSLVLTSPAAATFTAPVTFFAQVKASVNPDPDSTPNNDTNQTANEDDESLLVISPQAVAANSDLQLTMTGTPLTVTNPGTASLTLTLLNNGPTNASNIVTNVSLPAGVVMFSTTATTGTYAGNSWTVPALANGASTTLTLQVNTTITTAQLVFAQVMSATQNDPDSPHGNDAGQTANEDDEAALTFTPQVVTGGSAADLSMTITSNVNAPALYTNVLVTIKVKNNGPNTATGLKASFVLPAGFSFVSNTNVGGTYESWIGLITVPSLASGAEASFEVNLFVLTQAPTNFFAQITQSGNSDPDSTPNNNTSGSPAEDDEAILVLPNDGTVGPIIKKCDLELTLAAPVTSFAINDIVEYTLYVVNKGDTSAFGTTVSFPIPSSMQFVSADVVGYAAGVWTVGTLGPLASKTIKIKLKALSAAAAITVFAQVAAATPLDKDSTPGNDTNQTANEDDEAGLTLFPLGAGNTVDLQLSITTTGTTYAIWNNKDFTYTVTNLGFVPATNVTVSIPFPQYFVFSDKLVSQGNFDLYFYVWTVGTLAPGQSAQCKLTLFNLNNSGPITAYAQVMTHSPSDSDSAPGNGTPGTVNEDDEAKVTLTSGAAFESAPEAYLPDDYNPLVISKMYPVPTYDLLQLHIVSAIEQRVDFNIIDSRGAVVSTFELDIQTGPTDHSIHVLELPAGTYFIQPSVNKHAKGLHTFVKF